MSAIPLHLAAFDGDNDSVNRFLSEGAAVDTVTDNSETALFFAATRGHTDTVRTLLKWGADVNIVPVENGSALRQAVRGGYAEIVRLLLAKGADPEAPVPSRTLSPEEKAKWQEQMRESLAKMRQMMEAFGVTESSDDRDMDATMFDVPEKPAAPPPGSGKYDLLMMALQSGSSETLKVLLDVGYSPNPPDGKKQRMGLLDFARAIPNGIELARLLLQYGADPNETNAAGNSSLKMAVLSGNVPFAQLLIEFGAHTDSGEPGVSLLSYAVLRENEEMITLLLDHNVGVDDKMAGTLTRNHNRPDLLELIQRQRGVMWLKLVEIGDIDGVKAALRNSADIQARNDKGRTALYLAAEKGNATMVGVLLEAGADVNKGGDNQISPLHVAATEGATEVMALLLEQGAGIDAETQWGQTPIYNAAIKSRQDAADLMIAHGARLSVIEAILLRRMDAVNDFWSRGTPITYANEAGMTPIHAATVIGDVDLVSWFLKQGVKIDAKYGTGNTPLSIAISFQHIDMVRMLLEEGADPTENDSSRNSPVQLAVTLRNEPILRLLLEHVESRKTHSSTGGSIPPSDMDQRPKTLARLLSSYRLFAGMNSKDLPPLLQDQERLWTVVRTLIEFGAEVNSTDNQRNSILESCIEFGAPIDLIRSLIDKGAAVNPTTLSKKSPLMVAVQQGRVDVVEALLGAGANPNGGMTTETPLQIARAKECMDIVALLEQFGASEAKRESVTEKFSGEANRFLLPAATKPSQSPVVNMRLLDFEKVREEMRSKRATKIAERRERLVEEIRAAGFAA